MTTKTSKSSELNPPPPPFQRQDQHPMPNGIQHLPYGRAAVFAGFRKLLVQHGKSAVDVETQSTDYVPNEREQKVARVHIL